jgi:hypothetical protein
MSIRHAGTDQSGQETGRENGREGARHRQDDVGRRCRGCRGKDGRRKESGGHKAGAAGRFAIMDFGGGRISSHDWIRQTLDRQRRKGAGDNTRDCSRRSARDFQEIGAVGQTAIQRSRHFLVPDNRNCERQTLCESAHVRRDASCTDLCALTLELNAAGGGKSTVKVSYIQPATGCGETK